MTLFDTIILAIIICFPLVGVCWGMMGLAFRSIGFIASIRGAYLLCPYIRGAAHGYFSSKIALGVTSGIISYLIALLSCTVAVHKTLKLLVKVRGGALDRLGGVLIGLCGGGALSLTIFMAITVFTSGSYINAQTLQDVVSHATSDKYPRWLQHSLTTPYLEEAAHHVIEMLPPDTLESIKLSSKIELIESLESLITDVSKKTQDDTTEDYGLSRDLDSELRDVLP